MRIERQIEYEAKDDAEAIQVARDRLGRDAVILSSRRVKLGGFLGFFKRDSMMVTAGILVPDREDHVKQSRERMVAFQHLLDVKRAVSEGGDPEHRSQESNSSGPSSAFSQSRLSTPTATVAKAYSSNTKPLSSADSLPLAKEVDEIKDILGKVLERLDETGKLDPVERDDVRDENATLLIKEDVDGDVARAISADYAKDASGRSFDGWLADRIPTCGVDFTEALGGKNVLFAGPTGVGKTTTIAKIAATQSLWQNRKVLLITADTYRIAAVEQLRTYAKIMGAPIEIAAEPKDIQIALKKHKDADLVLLDTAGRSHYDSSRMDELRNFYDAFSPDSVHLVLAANTKYRDMLDVIERMGIIPLSALIFTKLDETSSYGTILNIISDFNLPVSFFTVGQNVPNDIEVARGDRFVDFLMGKYRARKE